MMRAGWRILFYAAFISIAPSSVFGMGKIVLGVPTTLDLIEGKESLEAVKLAAAEINAQGGVRVGPAKMTFKVVPFDLGDALPEASIPQVLASFDRFIQETRIHALVVGPFRSEVLLPAMDIIARHEVPMLGTIAMTPVTDMKIIRDPKYRYVFRVGLNSKYLVAVLIDIMKHLHDRFGYRKVFIMHQDVAWAKAAGALMIRIYFNRVGWRVLGLESYSSGSSDFSQGLTRAREAGADVIMPLFDAPGSSRLVKQWNEMKVPALLCGFISPMIGPAAWKGFEGKIAGSLNVVFELGNIPSTKYAPATAFYEDFKRQYGREIEAGHGPAPAYESVYILREAIERAGTLDPNRMVSSLEKTDRLGVMGRIRFNIGHQAIFGNDPFSDAIACVFQWREGGERKIVYPPAVAEDEITLSQTIAGAGLRDKR
jgi:branched-chain amino acid transport system substrate-binding protein